MIKLKWITVSYYVDEDTGEKISKNTAERYYVIKKKIKHVIKTKYNEWHQKVVGLYNYEGITEITNICTRAGKQISIFND